jgi:hypothetical protein
VKRRVAVLAALLLGLPVAASAGIWTHAGETGVVHDSNAGNAGTIHDRRDANALYAAGSATWTRRYGGYTALQFRHALGFEQWTGVGALTNTRYAARLRLLHRPGRGFHTPVFAAFAGAGARHSASDIRGGFDFRSGLSATTALTTTVQVRGEAAWTQRESSGRAFDLDVMSYSVALDWRATPRVTAYGGMRYDDGDFTVTARGFGIVQPKDEHLYLEPRASAIEADPAFGPDWWAFRVNGRTLIATLGVNVPLSPMLALDAQWQGARAEMNRFDYVRDVASLGLLFRW